jgi:hypothetical protein
MVWALLPSASAFELRLTADGEPVRWPHLPVPYTVSEPVPEVADALHAAFDNWASVEDASVAFEEQDAPLRPPPVGPDSVNVVFMDPAWPFGDAALAMASVWADRDGNLVAFDIQIAPDADWSIDGGVDGYDLEAAVTHEVGHALGLEHTPIRQATMYASQGRGEVWRRDLARDDEAAIAFLYPPDDDDDGADGGAGTAPRTRAAHDPPTTLLGAAHCAHAPGAWPGAALLVPLLSRRRRAPGVP